MNRLYASLIVATLLFIPTFWKSEGAKSEVKPAPVTTQNPETELKARKKAAFRKGHALLAEKHLPFNPDELLEPRWQQRLKPKLDQMPELQLVQQGTHKLKGAQLAHTLYLPDNVQLTGDTVILARRLVFLGRNVVIKGPYDIHIFTLDETQLVDNSSLKNKAGAVKVGFLPTTALASLKPVQGHITIDTSAGRSQNPGWQQVAKAPGRTRQDHHAAIPQNYDGGNGATGPAGLHGNMGQPGGSGANGPNGSCPEDIDGRSGESGSSGTSGSDGGSGGNGNDGGPGGNVSFTAQMGQSYNVSANGGRGGDGGPGGSGGPGGGGGSGGKGGDGASCPCNGSNNTSRGGDGGGGGYGGSGGAGADGGNGGRGGDGGTINIDYPSGYNINNISASADAGAGGNAGSGGGGGGGGFAGSPGAGGNGNRGLACTGDGANGSTGFTASNGSEGNAGNSGQPGSNGNAGSVNFNPTGGGEEGGCNFDWECECECVCFDHICSFASPIVIDVMGNGFDLTNGVNGVRFDLNADGVKRGLAWTSVSTDDAWLALDRNGNGSIDDGKELFGDVTQQPTSEFPNGFQALAEFDKPAAGGNGDGMINNQDGVFSSLRLWRDTNHNGISEASELHPLQSLNVETLHLDFKSSKRVDRFGNEFRYRSKITDSKDAQLGRWAWDVFLVSPR